MLYEEEDHPGLYEKEYYHHQACGHSDHPSTGYIQLSSSKDSFGTFDNGSMQPYKFSCHKKLIIVKEVISCDVSPVAMFSIYSFYSFSFRKFALGRVYVYLSLGLSELPSNNTHCTSYIYMKYIYTSLCEN